MPDLTARLGLPIIAPAQAQKHVTHNEALQLLDGVVQAVLVSIGAQTPPLLPAAGDVYALGPAPTGAWSGQAGQLAQWQFDQWHFIPPEEGWQAWDLTDGVMRVYRDGGWADVLQNLAGLGIGTTSDAQNLLAVASPASLFSHAGADHQLKINKAGASDSAVLLYQSGWEGHAEMGLAGDNDFHIKTSADGSSWTEALVIDAASGLFSGAAVQASPTDATSGRVMTVGAFGLGGLYSTLTAADNYNSVAPGMIGNTSSPPPGNAPGSGPWSGFYSQGNADAGVQILAGGNVEDLRFRILRSSATWKNWRKIFDTETILGAVSQSAGVPTGAILERGSNANGEYVRFADGTQICWSQSLGFGAVTTPLGAGYRSNDLTWAFPAAFSDGTKTVISGQSSSPTRWMSFQLPGMVSVVARLVAFTSWNGSETGRLIAVGRWY